MMRITMIIRMRQIRTHDVTWCGLNTLLKCHPSSSSPCRLETVKLINLPLHSGRGSLLPTPHILLTYHNIRDEHSWTKTSLNRTVQVVKRRHATERWIEMVRPVLERLCMSWALGRDSNNSIFNPDVLATQVLS